MGQKPFTLAAALVVAACMAGCVIFPVPHGGNKFKAIVGAADSAAPLRVGVSDRAQVSATLGTPWNAESADKAGRSWRFVEFTRTGYLIFLWPFIHGGPVQQIHRTDNLAIWFDPDGKVRRYATWGGSDRRPPTVAAEDAEDDERRKPALPER